MADGTSRDLTGGGERNAGLAARSARSEMPSGGAKTFSRRGFVARALASAGALAGLSQALARAGLATEAAAAAPDLVTQTFNGLAAFVVPGPDDYSLAQGVSTPEPGGVDAHAGEALVAGLNFADASQPALAAGAATLLNSVAVGVDAGSAIGQFASPFANLRFDQKGVVFSILEGAPNFEQFRPLVGVLPALAAFLSYSEVGVFNPATRSIGATPVGWQISSYDGVADGRDELVGYFEGRRRADA
jgi:hypothetical protein